MRKLFLIPLFIFCLASAAFAIYATIDPLDIGVGTRALGMGKAFVAQADDTNSIFLNPAGLSYVNNWGITSMYTSLLSEISYTTIGYSRSNSMEGWGIGYVGANIGGDTFTTMIDPVTHRIVPLDAVAVGYSSNLLLFSYGVLLSKYFDYPNFDRTSFGLSFKAFYQTLKSTEEFTASGYDLDIGLIYKYNSWLKFGLYGQNILPDSFGFAGTLRWDDGATESIPPNYMLGLNLKVLGSGAYWAYPQDLFWNFVFEDSGQASRPSVYHTGLEWWPTSVLAFRLGLDQDVHTKVAGNGIDDNLTFGLGYWYGDLGVDYAYHQYGPVAANITHYFSLSYGFPWQSNVVPAEKPVSGKPVEYLYISEPQDKSVIYRDFITVSGEVTNDKVAEVRINDNNVPFSLEGGKVIFTATVGIGSMGKHTVKIKCLDANNEILKEYVIRLVRLPSFTDVPDGYWTRYSINLLAMLNVFGGYPDGTFRPDKKINRAELTSILVRAKGYTTAEPTDSGFKDVPKASWASYFIKNGVSLGLVSGYPDKTFQPSKSVNRAEGVTIISRFAQLNEPEELPVGPFSDVPGRHWAAKSITAAKSSGLLMYLLDKPFEPSREMSRAEAAEILSKTNFVRQKESELFDWNAGF